MEAIFFNKKTGQPFSYMKMRHKAFYNKKERTVTVRAHGVAGPFSADQRSHQPRVGGA